MCDICGSFIRNEKISFVMSKLPVITKSYFGKLYGNHK